MRESKNAGESKKRDLASKKSQDAVRRNSGWRSVDVRKKEGVKKKSVERKSK